MKEGAADAQPSLDAFPFQQAMPNCTPCFLKEKQPMLNPFLPSKSPDEPPAPNVRPAYVGWLPLLLYVVMTAAFLGMAMRVPNIIAASLFVTAALVSVGAGVILGLSIWIFPELPR